MNNHSGTKAGRKARVRRPISERDYLYSDEVAHEIGCSTVTVNRIANGKLSGYPPLHFVPIGKRARVFRKPTVRAWVIAVEEMSQHANIGASNPIAGHQKRRET